MTGTAGGQFDRGAGGRPVRVGYFLAQCWHRVPGGTASAAVGLGRALRGRPGVDLVGLGPARGGASGPPGADMAGLRWDSVSGRWPLPLPLVYELWSRGSWPRPACRERIDLLHFTAPVAPRRVRAPFVVTLHDIFPWTRPDSFTPRGRRIMGRALETFREGASVVMCSSEATRRDCVDTGFDPDRLRVVPLGVEQVLAGPGEVVEVARRHGLRRRYVLWVGSLEPRKGVRTLLDAAAAWDAAGADLVLVGPSGWHGVEDQVASARSPSVRWLGHVPDGDLRALYAGAAVFCFPSLAEGFGLPVLEAMVQGAPVVTSRGTSTEEVAGEAAELVDPGDAAGVAEAVLALLADRDRALQLGEAGRSRAAEFTWERSAGLVERAYREALAGEGEGS